MYERKQEAKLIEATLDGQTHYMLKFKNGMIFKSENWNTIKGQPSVQIKQTVLNLEMPSENLEEVQKETERKVRELMDL